MGTLTGIFFLKVFVYVKMFYLHGCFWTMRMPVSHGSQKKFSDPLEIELHMWVLGIKVGSSGRAVSILHSWVSSPLQGFFKNIRSENMRV